MTPSSVYLPSSVRCYSPGKDVSAIMVALDGVTPFNSTHLYCPLNQGRVRKNRLLAKGGQGCRAGTGSEGQRPEASKVLQRNLFTLTTDDEKF
jgi:hypothetical protein